MARMMKGGAVGGSIAGILSCARDVSCLRKILEGNASRLHPSYHAPRANCTICLTDGAAGGASDFGSCDGHVAVASAATAGAGCSLHGLNRSMAGYNWSGGYRGSSSIVVVVSQSGICPVQASTAGADAGASRPSPLDADLQRRFHGHRERARARSLAAAPAGEGEEGAVRPHP